jgi:hypothetical protein
MCSALYKDSSGTNASILPRQSTGKWEVIVNWTLGPR